MYPRPIGRVRLRAAPWHRSCRDKPGSADHPNAVRSRDESQTIPCRPRLWPVSALPDSSLRSTLFLGDQKPTFDGLKASLRAGLNLGLLGFAYWTADVFDLDGKATPETHMRYAQWALLNPVARYFWRPPEIDDTRFPWSHGEVALANFVKYTELRYRLLPYLTWLGYQAWQTGIPLMRPLVLEYQNDPRLAGVDDQVMLGEALMICPVTQDGARSEKSCCRRASGMISGQHNPGRVRVRSNIRLRSTACRCWCVGGRPSGSWTGDAVHPRGSPL